MCPHHIRRLFNRALSGVFSGLLLAAPGGLLRAQETPRPKPASGFVSVYDAEHETRIVGTIDAVTEHVDGSPAGMHVLIRGSSGVVDAHVGPSVPQAIQKALRLGAVVEVVGAMETAHRNQVLLVRELIVAHRSVSVRTGRGFLAQQYTASNGGLR